MPTPHSTARPKSIHDKPTPNYNKCLVSPEGYVHFCLRCDKRWGEEVTGARTLSSKDCPECTEKRDRHKEDYDIRIQQSVSKGAERKRLETMHITKPVIGDSKYIGKDGRSYFNNLDFMF